jgi:hypothetical protein
MRLGYPGKGKVEWSIASDQIWSRESPSRDKVQLLVNNDDLETINVQLNLGFAASAKEIKWADVLFFIPLTDYPGLV